MSQRGNGYNNPAYCNQFDNSIYDYEYVPEIDPDSPTLQRESSYRQPKQVPPWSHRNQNQQKLQQTEDFENSDESNRSIIIEERNNRRVTLICEKRTAVREEDGGYAHDISLESNYEEDNERGFIPNEIARRQDQKPNNFHRPNIINRHRYEDLDEFTTIRPNHRYAEINDEFESENIHFVHRKPRARSPQECYGNLRRTPSPIGCSPHSFYNGQNDFRYNHQTSSPIQSPNVFELSDFSPPRRFERQPPVGASASQVTELLTKPKNCNKKTNYKIDNRDVHTPSQPKVEKRNLLSTPKSSPKIITPRTDGIKKPLVRRNISSSFHADNSSPYRPTTQSINNRHTAVITPILQRKFSELTSEKMSRMFQSTGNVLKGDSHLVDNAAKFQYQSDNVERIKRNKSVPNFQQHFPGSKRTPVKIKPNVCGNVAPLMAYQLDDQSSPAQSPKSLSKSRASLLANVKSSWSNLGSESYVASSPCITISALLQIAAGAVSCALCFFMLSRLGRRYYLDLGMISGFVNIVLGVLGFRAQRWKWLPHRNYVTGYFALAFFSLITCGSLVLIITVRPMTGDPLLDVTAGAICTISVISIAVALTGLTMSGCCKAPPPDNRVSYA